MSKLSVLIVLSSSLTVMEVSSFNFKYSNGNGNNNSPGGYSYWNTGYNRPYSQQVSQYSQPVQIQTEEPKDLEEDPEYMYELLFGHQIRDLDKHRRQQGCLCNNRFRDPHCGSDQKVYDNGCYFECAQKRTPGLKLLNWGKC